MLRSASEVGVARRLIWVGSMLTLALAGACSAAGDGNSSVANGASTGSGGSSAGSGGSSAGGSSGGGTGGAAGGGGTGGINVGTGGTGAAAGQGGSGAAAGQPGTGGGCNIDGGGPVGSGGSGGNPGGSDVCGNGLDDNLNGFIDEGCGCGLGATQACYSGPPGKAGIGACVKGTQTCQGNSEFPGWSKCSGDVLPTNEICGDGIDNNCDGQIDEYCDCCPGDTRPCGANVGVCTQGTQLCENGKWSDCDGIVATGPEICDNGIDDNCDGQQDEGCTLDVDVNINGDCVSAYCPPQAPYPIGCNIVMSGNDPRGCVANSPGSAQVYFQEGNACGAGHVSGTLKCSSQQPTTPLDGSTCPINKSTPIYALSQSGCPPT